MIRVLLVLALLTGCAARELPPIQFGPDPYAVECRDGQIWLTNKYGDMFIGDPCNE